MKWLILSQNKKDRETLENAIRLREKSSIITSTSLSKEESGKWAKGLYDITDVIITGTREDLSNPDTAGLIYSLAGYCTRGNIPLFTNISEIETYSIGNSDVIKVMKDLEEIETEIKNNYPFIMNAAKKHEAEKSLMNKGIPFTVDCFASYISKGKFEICRQFITAGMDINSRDESGTPMLNIAVRTDKEEIVSWMIDNGAEINVQSQDRGYTPVMDAVWRGNKEITQFLIEHGADLNTICKEGQSNLIIAVGSGKADIVELLAMNGANPDIKDSMGMSAYDYAVLFKKDDLTRILFPYHNLPS